MIQDARPDGTVDPVTMTPTAAPAAPAKVTCACGAQVEPTRVGGHRPRPHLDPRTRTACAVVHATESVCKRCGGAPNEPNAGCTSQVFHPAEWVTRRMRVGNAAAAGQLLGVSGEYFLLLLRRYRPGSASRPPKPAGYDLERQCRYWDLDAVRAWVPTRPGKGHAPR